MKYVVLAFGLVLGGCNISTSQRETISPQTAEDSGSFNYDSVEKQIHEHYKVMESLEKMGWMNPNDEYPEPL
jgi:hypothetical protein